MEVHTYCTEVEREEEKSRGQRRYERMAFLDWSKGVDELRDEILRLEDSLSRCFRGQNVAWNRIRLDCLRVELQICEQGGLPLLDQSYSENRIPWQSL